MCLSTYRQHENWVVIWDWFVYKTTAGEFSIVKITIKPLALSP